MERAAECGMGQRRGLGQRVRKPGSEARGASREKQTRNERSVMTVGSSVKFLRLMKSELCYGGKYMEKKSVLVLPQKETYKNAKKME